MEPEIALRFTLTRRHLITLLVTVAVLDLGLLATTATIYSQSVTRGAWGGWGERFRLAFDLGSENNLGPWFSGVGLLLVAAVWLVCFALETRSPQSPMHRRLSGGWLLLAALFTALSFDEVGSLHERVGDLQGVNQFELFFIPLLVLGLFMAGFAWLHLRQSRLGLVLLTLGFLAFLSVPIQERAEALLEATGRYAATWHTHTRDVLLEEGSELLGSFFFLVAGLVYGRRASLRLNGPSQAEWIEFPLYLHRPAVLRAVRGTVLALALGFAAMQIVILPLLPPDSAFRPGQLGYPAEWFAGVLALLAGLASLLVAKGARRAARPGTRAFYLLLGIYSLLVSVHFGAGHLFSDLLWPGSPRRMAAFSALLGAGAVLLALAAFRLRQTLVERLAVWSWAGFLALSLLQPEPRGSMVAFAAFALLLPGLIPPAMTWLSTPALQPGLGEGSSTPSPRLPPQEVVKHHR